MTPKEKAIELVNKFKIGDVVTEKLQVVNIDIYSKLFALRAVDEILEDNRINYMLLGVGVGKHYWKEVKQEIEAL
jgi:hypothetical protein